MNRVTIFLLLAWTPICTAKTTIWDGSASGDWSVAANWDNGVPADGDTVIFNATAVNVDSGLSAGETDLAALIISQGYTGSIGTSASNPLVVDADLVVWDGGGSASFLDSGTDGFDAVYVTRVGTGKQALTLQGTIGDLVIKWGDVTISDDQAGTTAVTNVYLEPASNNSSLVDFTADVLVDDVTGTVSITNLYQRAGVTEIGSASVSAQATLVNLYMDSGTCSYIDDSCGTNIYQRGGSVYWSTNDPLTLAIIYGGTFDCSDDQRAKTITTLIQHEGSIVNLDNVVDNITLTNGVKRYGGTLTTPVGATITY